MKVSKHGFNNQRRTVTVKEAAPLAPKPDNPHIAPSRTAPDWRTTELKYDLDAHRRLALIGR